MDCQPALGTDGQVKKRFNSQKRGCLGKISQVMFSDYLELYTDGVRLRDITHVLIDFLARALNTSQTSLVTMDLLGGPRWSSPPGGQVLLGHARGDQALEHDHEATGRFAQRVVGFHLEELEELLPHLVHH